MILFILLAQPSPEGGSNVALDDERLQESVPKGLQKVELDLDDALFLEFEEKEEPAPTPAEPALEPEEKPVVPHADTSAKRRWPKPSKLWIFGIAAALCLLLGAGAGYFFMKSGQEKPEEASKAENISQSQTPSSESKPEVNATVELPTPAKPALEYTYSLEQFQVEYVLNDQIRFLTCRFSIKGVSEILRYELQQNSLFIRDGVYRYLKNSPLSFLDNPENSDRLKSDLVTVVNKFLKSGQVSEILLEEYVVK